MPARAVLDATVDQVAKRFNEPGMVVLIKTPAGDYTDTYGTTALGGTTPVTLDTRFRIGSNTKTWTGTAILQMVDEGKLALSDPVSKYLPGVPNGDHITITDLMDMRSGLFNYSETLELSRALDDDPQRVWTPQELLALAFAHPPYFAPGQGFHYSNTNTILLGLIAESLDHKPLGQIFQDRFFTPLGLSGTSFPAAADSSLPAPFSRGYMYGTNVGTLASPSLPPDQLAQVENGTLQPSDVTNENPSWAWAAGSGISTADDLATWVKALVRGDLLSPATQSVRMHSFQPFSPDDPSGPGYGFTMMHLEQFYGHTGEIPGYSSFMGYDPVNDVTMVIWANLAPAADGTTPASALSRKLIPLIYASTVPTQPEGG